MQFNENDEDNSQLIEGFLYKCSDKIISPFSNWKKIFYQFQDGKLKYFKTQNKNLAKFPSGVIDFNNFECIFIQKSNEFTIEIPVFSKKFKFKTIENDQGSQILIDKIMQKNKKSKQFDRMKLGDKNDKLWFFDNIEEKQFLQKADTGDLLLFKSNNIGAAITRYFTQSLFDHVAIILKLQGQKNKVYFIDATSTNNVSVNDWNDVRQHYGNGCFYQTIIYRSVQFQRSDDKIWTLQQFIQNNQSQKFEISFKKIMRKNTILKKQSYSKIQPEEQQTERTFFCSELVAKIFKTIGIIKNDDTSCSRFMPVDFSSKGESFLKLEEDVKIGEQLFILKN